MASVKPTFSVVDSSTHVLVEIIFPGCVSAAPLECDVLKSALMVTDTQDHYSPLTIELPSLFQEGDSWADCSYKAKFSKKQHTLTLTLHKPAVTAADVPSVAAGTTCYASVSGAADAPSPPITLNAAAAAAAAPATEAAVSLQEQAMQAALSDLQAQRNATMASPLDAASIPELSFADGKGNKNMTWVTASIDGSNVNEVDAFVEEVEYVWTMPTYASVRTMRPSAAHEHLFEVCGAVAFHCALKE